ncbi:MAG: hypothetical protein KGL39_36805 [Patescibacteria group bacterium]|nr:hypothetical protein [Patescibacteria group bacterium]
MSGETKALRYAETHADGHAASYRAGYEDCLRDVYRLAIHEREKADQEPFGRAKQQFLTWWRKLIAAKADLMLGWHCDDPTHEACRRLDR